MADIFMEYARLLTNESITLTYSKEADTAYFDVESRSIIMPLFEYLDRECNAALTAHECGHALYSKYTPEETIELSEKYGVRDMLFPLCVVDVTEKVKKDVHYAATAEDVKAYEAKYGAIPDGAFSWYSPSSICRSSGFKNPGFAKHSARWITFSSSRMFPGHWWACSFFRASGDKMKFSPWGAYCLMK